MNFHGTHSMLVDLQYNKARNMLMVYIKPIFEETPKKKQFIKYEN